MRRYAEEGVGEAIVGIVGSISAITARRYDNATMLANYAGLPPAYETPREIYDAAQRVKRAVEAVPGREGRYLNGMIDAFALYARILEGDQIPYAQAIETMQQVRLHPVPRDRFAALSARISEELGALGYSGTVGGQITAWLRDSAIPPEEVAGTAARFLERAKAATERRVAGLPQGDGIDAVNSVRGVFWSGLSRYLGNFRGDLTFNIDRPWSLPTFANILCHEGYPGHHAFYGHWDDLYRRGELPLEAAFYSTAGNPANPRFEGAPETGLHFLGWDDFREDTPEITDAEKRAFAIGRDVLDLQRMLQMQGCYLHHVEGAGHREVVAYMCADGIFTRLEAENTFRFFTHPVQQYYYPCYYYGRWMVYEGFEQTPREKRGEFFRLLYDRPHTNETFLAEVRELTGKPFDPFRDW